MTTPGQKPQAKIRQDRRFSLSFIWLGPVIAAAVGGYLFYKSEVDVGPTITITFSNGARISNTAKVVYRGVQVGAAQSVMLDQSLSHVNVAVRLDKTAADLAREGSQFWVVEPRVSIDKISGLSTLMSGSYIQVAPGSGKPTRHFTGLSEPPIVAAGRKELPLILEADNGESLPVGAPVSYRGITVGAITAVDLPDDGAKVRIAIAIQSQYAGLVRSNSVFWRASGIHARLNLLDPTINIGSLGSLIRGGINFATPTESAEAAGANTRFALLDEPPAPDQVEPPAKGLTLVLTTAQAGITDDAPVYYRKLQVGKVLRSRLNPQASAVEIDLVIEPQHAALVNSNSVFWNASGIQMDFDLSDPKIDVESLKALLVGGIAFATRGATGAPVEDGRSFDLLDHEPGDEAGSSTLPSGRRFVLVADTLGSISANDPVYYRQLQVGRVGEVELLRDGSAVAAYIYIEAAHADLVREDSVFWNASGIHANLNLFDPSIDIESAKALLRGGIAFATPSAGGPQAAAGRAFRLYSDEEGRKRTRPKPRGLRVVLSSDRLGSVAAGDSVYYREVAVGKVVATGFGGHSAKVLIHAVVDDRYAPLVRKGSVFWNASGLHVDFSLFKGASIDVESLKALLEGGIAFATPESGARATDGDRFLLHDKPQDEWLSWRPVIALAAPQPEPRLPTIETAALGFSVENMVPQRYATIARSRVRRGPGSSYLIIDTLKKGAEVNVTGRVRGLDWYRIRLRDGGTAFIWDRLLRPTKGAGGR